MSRQGPLANEAAQEHLRTHERGRERQIKEDLAKVLLIPAGRRFIWHLINLRCLTFANGFRHDTRLQDYELGRKSIGHDLQAEILAEHPGLFRQMFNEGFEDAEKDKSNRDAAQATKDDTE